MATLMVAAVSDGGCGIYLRQGWFLDCRVKDVVSDEDRRELIARALTMAQDTVMRDKRRALGRVIARAALDTGTKVDHELVDLRVLADLDELYVRLLRLMTIKPPHLDAVNKQLKAFVRQVGEATTEIIGGSPHGVWRNGYDRLDPRRRRR